MWLYLAKYLLTKYAVTIILAIRFSIFAAAKLIKVKIYIKTLGGIRTAASLLISATTTAERLEAGGTALVNLAAIVMGIDDIYEDCTF